MAKSQDGPPPAGDGGAPAKGADRVLATFKALAAYPRGATLEELSEQLASPKSSTHRALATLRRAGLAEQTQEGAYRIGFEALRLAFSYYEALDTRAVVEPALDQLAARFRETAHYAQLDGGEIVYVAKVVQRDHGVYMSSRIGGRNPAHATGVGKLLLAHELADEDAVREYAERHPLERHTDATIVDVAAFSRELATIRERGYSIDREENERGVGCVALPVFLGPGPEPSGAISVTSLLHRTDLQTLIDGVEDMRGIIREHMPLSEEPLSG